MTDQVVYADIENNDTDGENAALLINDIKRAANQTILGQVVIANRVTDLEDTILGEYAEYNYIAVGGEVIIPVPYVFENVNSLYVNGVKQTPITAWYADVVTQVITVAAELDADDEVTLILALDPLMVVLGIDGNTRYIEYNYKNGSADGGEVSITVPYNFELINSLYINGVRQTRDIAWEPDVANQVIDLASALVAGDQVVIEVGLSLEKILDNEIVSSNAAIVPVSGVGGTLTLAEMASGSSLPLATIVALRAFEPSIANQKAETIGHTLSGVGGGKYWYHQADTTSLENNGSIIVTPLGRRWKLFQSSTATFQQFGVLGNGGDETTIAQNAIDSVRKLDFSNGALNASLLNLPEDTEITGNGIFNVTNTLNLAGKNIKLDHITVNNLAQSYGCITSFSDCSGFKMNNVKLSSFAGSNGVKLVADSLAEGVTISDIEMYHNDFINLGRMGIETQNHVYDGVVRIHNLKIMNNKFKNLVGTFPFGVSISGLTDDVLLAFNEFDGMDIALENVGASNYRAVCNNFKNISGSLLSFSNDRAMKNCVVFGNTSDETTCIGARVFIKNTSDLNFSLNTLYSGEVIFEAINSKISGNTLRTHGTSTGLILEGGTDPSTGNVISDNDISTNHTSNFAVLRMFGATCTSNVLENNKLSRLNDTGGSYQDENSGASGNTLGPYYKEDGVKVDPVTSTLSDEINELSYAITGTPTAITSTTAEAVNVSLSTGNNADGTVFVVRQLLTDSSMKISPANMTFAGRNGNNPRIAKLAFGGQTSNVVNDDLPFITEVSAGGNSITYAKTTDATYVIHTFSWVVDTFQMAGVVGTSTTALYAYE
jgi:hypothetical protein